MSVEILIYLLVFVMGFTADWVLRKLIAAINGQVAKKQWRDHEHKSIIGFNRTF